MKKIILTLFSLVVLCSMLSAQVTVGSDRFPVSGALLQLKENEGATNNANRGLGMPRVKLKSLTATGNNLATTIDGASLSPAWDIDAHIGLMVYNTDHCFVNATGLYVWDGTAWQSLSKDETSLEGMAKKLGTAQDVIAPNGVAWHKDHEGNTFFSMNYDAANPTGSNNRWMTTNLATNSYGPRTDEAAWTAPVLTVKLSPSGLPYTDALWAYPNPDNTTIADNADTYNARPRLGLLYNYAAASGNQNPLTTDQGNTVHAGVQGICPTGWHLPTDLEWTQLENEIIQNTATYSSTPNIGTGPLSNSTEYRGTMHGAAMKDKCEKYNGQYPNTSNTVLNGGFSALICGRNYSGYIYNFGLVAFFWSSSSYDSQKAWSRNTPNPDNTVGRVTANRGEQYSVRCKKDNTPPCSTMTDADGNVYPAKLFGTQCWTTLNLRTTKDKSGAALSAPTINSGWFDNGIPLDATTEWMTSSEIVPSPINMTQQAFANKHGAMYNWADATKACPAGWHLPSDAEWTTLGTTLGGVATAGTKLKADNATYSSRDFQGYPWAGNASDSVDNSGFNALPSGTVLGDRSKASRFGLSAYWWTSSPSSSDGASYRGLIYNNSKLDTAVSGISGFFSVRCLRD